MALLGPRIDPAHDGEIGSLAENRLLAKRAIIQKIHEPGYLTGLSRHFEQQRGSPNRSEVHLGFVDKGYPEFD